MSDPRVLVQQGSLLNYVATVKLYEVTLGAPLGCPATLVDFNGTFDTDPHVRPAGRSVHYLSMIQYAQV